MPYIEKKTREVVDPSNELPVIGDQCDGPGELNFAICRLITGYLGTNVGGRPGYSDWNEVIGVLSCIQLEINRRFLGPLEETKQSINGDVFTDV